MIETEAVGVGRLEYVFRTAKADPGGTVGGQAVVTIGDTEVSCGLEPGPTSHDLEKFPVWALGIGEGGVEVRIGFVPILYPFCGVSGHIEEAIGTGSLGECSDWKCQHFAVESTFL